MGKPHPTGARGPAVRRPVSALSGPWLAHLQSGGSEGTISEDLSLPTPPPPALCFPGWILGFPQCKSWLSTLKCFNLLHPPRRALREAGRRPRLRTIKQFTASGAPMGPGRPVGEIGGPFPRGCPDISLHKHRMKVFRLHLTLTPSPLLPWLTLQTNSTWHPRSTHGARPSTPCVWPGVQSCLLPRKFQASGLPRVAPCSACHHSGGLGPPGTPAGAPVPSLTEL